MQEDRSLHDESQPRRGTGATLPRSAILRGRNAFSRVFESGSGTRAGRLVVKYRVVESDRRVVLAGFVLRRGTGNAVRRNRLKRLMREAYRHERRAFEERLPETVEVHLVVVWSGSPKEAPFERYERLRADLASALNKIVHRLRPRQDERSDQRS